jgi:HD-GYP domain-containing protein (c-di-GMP phosphodiesterase class II)
MPMTHLNLQKHKKEIGGKGLLTRGDAQKTVLKSGSERKDAYLDQHQNNVAFYASMIAQLACPKLIDLIYTAALFHDVGKIAVPDEVLFKPKNLTAKEWAKMRLHPVVGAELFAQSREAERLFREADKKQLAILAIRHHHERWDGSGYPDKLAGEQIPLPSRVLAIADAFDAMTTDRPYKKEMDVNEALQEIVTFSGKQFDPCLVGLLMRIMSI